MELSATYAIKSLLMQKNSNNLKINWVLGVACYIKCGIHTVSGWHSKTTINLVFCFVMLVTSMKGFRLRNDKGNSKTGISVRNDLFCEKHGFCLLWCHHWKIPEKKLFGQGYWWHNTEDLNWLWIDRLLELSQIFCFPFWVKRIREPDMWRHRRCNCKENHLSKHTQKV